jgi:hypothetical protein
LIGESCLDRLSRTVAAGVFSPLLTSVAVAVQTAATVKALTITEPTDTKCQVRRAVATDSQRGDHHPLNTSLVIRTPGSQVGGEDNQKKRRKQ